MNKKISSKRADLSLEMIVKVVIALLVLAFVFFLVSRSFNSGKSLTKCAPAPERVCGQEPPQGGTYIRYVAADDDCKNQQQGVCWQKIYDDQSSQNGP